VFSVLLLLLFRLQSGQRSPGLIGDRRGDGRGNLLVVTTANPISSPPAATSGSNSGGINAGKGSVAMDSRGEASRPSAGSDGEDGLDEQEDSDREAALNRALGARTLQCLSQLHRQGRLSRAEKVQLSAQVIASLSGAEEGRRESGQGSIQVAFALLMMGSAPDERLLDALSSERVEESGGDADYFMPLGALDLATVPEDDISDFVAFCRNYVKTCARR
jgi:hypothetical protein